jgi:PKD repeat protein
MSTRFPGKSTVLLAWTALETQLLYRRQGVLPEPKEVCAMEAQDDRRLLWIVGAVAIAILAVCVCIACLAVSLLIYLEKTSTPTPEPTPAIDQPPEAAINYYPVEAMVGEEVAFDGSQSRPGSSPIASYEWSFGDGTTGSGDIVIHVYNAIGIYQVTLTVTGEDGLGNTGGPVEIAIRDAQAPTPTPTPTPPTTGELPEPVINYPVEGTVGVEVTFDGSESRPGSSPIASYVWDFGDGTTGLGASVTHIYNAPGTYQVTLTVTDENWLSSTGGPVAIAIKDAGAAAPTPPGGQPPEPVTVFLSEGKVGQGLTFDGSQSRPGSSPIASYVWDFGDGTTGSGVIVIHIYRTPGAYQVTLMVTGEDGLGNTSAPEPITITE